MDTWRWTNPLVLEDKNYTKVLIPSGTWTSVSVGSNEIWMRHENGNVLEIHFALRPPINDNKDTLVQHKNIFDRKEK
jgi:hypothetical protein